ncbi:MAG: heavy metal translocating P-type ATPase [Solobacterium sp.]|nr:heavy metal translocating P-type ATPase [Solobacterium sp.]
MNCRILHESAGRMRVHFEQPRMTMAQADILEAYLTQQAGVQRAKVSERTGNAVIVYNGLREAIIQSLAGFNYEDCGITADEHSGRKLNREFQEKLVQYVSLRLVKRLFFPLWLRNAITVCGSIPYLANGLKTLASGTIRVPVLDAASIGISILNGSYDTASSVMFLLGLSDILEEWTHRRSVEDLARSMALNIDQVWVKNPDGTEGLKPLSELHAGDRFIVRTSATIPLDGIVEEGEMTVNQSSMTGESQPVYKRKGSLVYAGTIVEEGSSICRVTCSAGEGRYDRIIEMIEASERLKSDTENRAALLADRLVPYSFLATILTWLVTRSVPRATAVLMVDYSCALKLAMPVSVLSAMRECARYKILVKGGKYLEQIAKADTIVFDKTGTLTYSKPETEAVIPFGGWDETEVLRLAACLEEHYPHSIANAVVSEAKRRGITHEEKHSEVEYIVAHGIASSIEGKKTVIGSSHFVFEDEGCTIPEGEQERFDALPAEFSHLYLAVGGTLAGVILIRDPMRPEAPYVINSLRDLGFRNIVMMTGDSFRTAETIARRAGVDRFFAEVLPEDKASYVAAEKQNGHTVIMLGDGINDSPALAEADCGIAVSDGAMIAREIADVAISDEKLYSLLTLKQIADLLERRIDRNYRFIMSFNSALILGGIFGILPASLTALLHNASTFLITLNSLSNLNPDEFSELVQQTAIREFDQELTLL